MTRHRQAVLAVVQSSLDHPTARQIHERVVKSHADLSVATVYNSLKYLAEAGLVRAVPSEEESVRYEGVSAPHDHLVCRRCGSIEDADLLSPAEKRNLKTASSFRMEGISLHITGVCAACQERAEKAD